MTDRLASLGRRALARVRRAPAPGRPRAASRPPPHPDKALRGRLVGQGARLDPTRPADVWRPWPNTVLHNRAEVDVAVRAVSEAGLHPHPDDPKNWDSLLALGLILERFAPTARVMDAGATLYSRLLPWLYLYGYRRLHGVDLTFEEPVVMGPIRYEQMDLTATTFEDASFEAIACLSVVEHGVPRDGYLREMSRLLRPGGLLVTSTDFWCEPVETAGHEAYGVEAKVFTPADLTDWADAAAGHGFRLISPLDLRCEEKVVHWERVDLDFTFANFVLERVGEAG